MDTLTLPGRLLAGDGKEMRELLADAGFIVPQQFIGRRALSEFIGYWQDCPIIEMADQVGWIDGSFALPEEIIQPTGSKKNVVLDLKNACISSNLTEH